MSFYVLEYLGLREGPQTNVYVVKGLHGLELKDREKVKFASRVVFFPSSIYWIVQFQVHFRLGQ